MWASLTSVEIDAMPAAPHVIHAQAAWALACELEQVDCSKIPTPKIVPTELFTNYGAFGAWTPEQPDSILIDNQLVPMLADELIESVLAHEMTHYIDSQVHGLEWMAQHGCETEWNGWRAGNAYLVSHGRPDLADYNWAARYGCFGESNG